jgi:hypothetical protein
MKNFIILSKIARPNLKMKNFIILSKLNKFRNEKALEFLQIIISLELLIIHPNTLLTYILLYISNIFVLF